MQTERVTFLTSPSHKASLARRAAARGISIGEYVRRRTVEDDELTPEQEAELAMLIVQVNASVPKMNESIDTIIESMQQARTSIRDTLSQLDRRT